MITITSATRLEMLQSKKQRLEEQIALTKTQWVHSAYSPRRAMYAYDLRFYDRQLEDVEWTIFDLERGW